MPSGRVSNVKYAGNCKTNMLEPEKAVFYDKADSLFLFVVFHSVL